VPLGESAPFPIILGTPAPAGGVVVTLTSSNTSRVILPTSSVFVPAGAMSPAVQPQVVGHNVGSSTITASAPGYSSASVEVRVTATITVDPVLNISAGSGRLLHIQLSAAAGLPVYSEPGGYTGYVEPVTLYLSSSNESVAWLQPSVNVYSDGSNYTTVVVWVNGLAPGTASIRVSSLPYIPEVTATVVVQ
jgi:hypothetical protein